MASGSTRSRALPPATWGLQIRLLMGSKSRETPLQFTRGHRGPWRSTTIKAAGDTSGGKPVAHVDKKYDGKEDTHNTDALNGW